MTKYASQLKSVVDILKIYINLTRNFNAVCCFPLPLQTFGKNSNQIRATSSAKVCIQTFGINMDNLVSVTVMSNNLSCQIESQVEWTVR